MVLLAATGFIAGPQLKFRELIASSATFQSIVGEVSEAAALNHVVPWVERAPSRPLALVGIPITSTTSLRVPNNAVGQLRARFEFDVDASHIPASGDTDAVASEKLQNSGIDFGNKVGAIIQEIMIESLNGGRLLIRSVDMIEPGITLSKKYERASLGDYMKVTVVANYGAA